MSMPKLGSTPWQAALKSEGGGEGSSLKLDVEAGEYSVALRRQRWLWVCRSWGVLLGTH